MKLNNVCSIMNAMKTFLTILPILSSVFAEPGKLSFASYFGNHMVLQRAPQRATLWGYAANLGEEVHITFTGDIGTYRSLVTPGPNNEKIWVVKLAPVSDPGPYNVTLSSSEGNVELQDLLFGDVWLCSGQSNMQFTLVMGFNATQELEQASLYPDIRVFTASEETASTEQHDLIGIEENWSIPSKATLGAAPWTYFSAVCWLYGKHLYQNLHYPIGLVSSTWGGTPIEYWSSPQALGECNHKYVDERLALGASQLWNAMIYPFSKMTIYGAIWYQGEANAGNPDSYVCRFPAMINDWRKVFNKATAGETKDDFPFGFVQLAPYRNDSSIVKGFPDIRWHQTADIGYVPNSIMPNTFMAVAMDLPDFTSPYGSIHPRDKQTVGHRLMLSGMSVAYKKNMGRFQGPRISAFDIDIGYFTLRLEFSNGTVPIQVFNTRGFEVCCSSNNQSKCDGSDSVWAPAPIIKNDETSLTMSYKGQCSNKWIMGLRYEWRESPCPYYQCALYTKENQIPAEPFIELGLIGGGSTGPRRRQIQVNRVRKFV